MLTKEQLRAGLTTDVIGKKLFVFETIDSTNSCAKVLAEVNMEEGTVVLAEYQTEGRGRLGRSWLSEPAQNLLFSIILKPPLHRSLAGLLPFFAAVGVAHGIERTLSLPVECKWPNDLLINGKKCCGILLESSFTTETLRYAILGIGINVNQNTFEPSLGATATSLRCETHKQIDRVLLFQHIVRELDSRYAAISKGDFTTILEEWKKRTTFFGTEVTVVHHNVTYSGIAERINEQGGLVVRTARGVKTFYAGDVSLRY